MYYYIITWIKTEFKLENFEENQEQKGEMLFVTAVLKKSLICPS